MSKSQVRKGHSGIRERIRFAVDCLRADNPPEAKIEAAISWLHDAEMLSREVEKLSIEVVHAAEKGPVYKDRSTPDNKAYWDSVKAAADEVATWPDWKKR